MQKYEALTEVGGVKPQDFWDTATYLFLQGMSPEEAAERFKSKRRASLTSDPLSLKVAKLAMTYPQGSEPRRKLMGMLRHHVAQTERKALIRKASALPKGSEERRKILAELKEAGSWGSNDYVSKRDGSWNDVIIMSPNGDSFLVGGEETYPQDVPSQLKWRASQKLNLRVPEPKGPKATKLVELLRQALRDPRNFWEVAVSYHPEKGWDL
jgi:hypothetical protein